MNLMENVTPFTSAPARQVTCPTCGSQATDVSVRLAQGIYTGSYVCGGSHIWMTRWIAGGAA